MKYSMRWSLSDGSRIIALMMIYVKKNNFYKQFPKG